MLTAPPRIAPVRMATGFLRWLRRDGFHDRASEAAIPSASRHCGDRVHATSALAARKGIVCSDYSAGGSRTSRTLRASRSGVYGLARKEWPISGTSSKTAESA